MGGFTQKAFATHIRAGEITVKRISTTTLTYKITLTVYTDSLSPIDDPENKIYYGDGTSEVKARTGPRTAILGKGTWVSVYEYTHTYPATGSYLVYYIGENRNVDVKNMANSSSTQFYVETRIIIDPFLGINNTPVLTNPAIDLAGIGQKYFHTTAAYDPDGDSLSYENIPSMKDYNPSTQTGVVVDNYQNPAVRAGGLNETQTAPATHTINPVTGILTWDAPQLVGYFNTAIRITEWRRGRAIGYVVRDIQIIVRDTRNYRPKLIIPKDTCIAAGTVLNKTIIGLDTNLADKVKIMSYGGVYALVAPQQAAIFTPPTPANPAFGQFSWTTSCADVREQPYDVTFKAEDIPVFAPVLATTEIWRITVVAPAPQLTSAIPQPNKSIILNWQNYICTNASTIAIYRKIDSSDFVADNCNIGLAASSGFVKIGEVSSTTTSFTDNNGGTGLKRGTIYCYRIVAVFPAPAGGESYASNEVCASLLLDVPVMTNASVQTTAQNGQMFVRWIRPLAFDKTLYPAPYQYRVFRADGLSGTNYTQVHQANNIADTSFIDQVDTRQKEYRYKVGFYYGNNATLLDTSDAAASIQLTASGGVSKIDLTWKTNTAWSNTNKYHLIYRQVNNVFVVIDSVKATGNTVSYTDNGTYLGIPLQASQTYFYKIQTRGAYQNQTIGQTLYNDSYEISAIPRDTVAPCAPYLAIDSLICPTDCQTPFQPNNYNVLTWKPNRVAPCDTDIISYNIYFTATENQNPTYLATTTDTVWTHQNLSSLAGCYEVTALDQFGNESARSNRVCKDNCILLEFPNVFTPNDDNKNQTFRPICITPQYIKSITFRVYNRWGKKLYETSDREKIQWDGTITGNQRQASTGTYFYSAEVEFFRLNPRNAKRLYRGWLDLLK